MLFVPLGGGGLLHFIINQSPLTRLKIFMLNFSQMTDNNHYAKANIHIDSKQLQIGAQTQHSGNYTLRSFAMDGYLTQMMKN